MRHFINGKLKVHAHFDVILFTQLVELIDGLELLRKIFMLFFNILEGVHLFHVNIQACWELV